MRSSVQDSCPGHLPAEVTDLLRVCPRPGARRQERSRPVNASTYLNRSGLARSTNDLNLSVLTWRFGASRLRLRRRGLGRLLAEAELEECAHETSDGAEEEQRRQPRAQFRARLDERGSSADAAHGANGNGPGARVELPRLTDSRAS